WTMTDDAGGVIGFTGGQPWPREWGPRGEIEIGWRLAREYWGKGYATAAAQMTLERLRAAGVPKVVAMVRPGNERSVAVARRLGMELAETFPHPLFAEEALCFRLDL
ncbi:GNAT family N-acetyltransferase, partial [Streptomyces sp. NPDC005921]